MKVLILGAAGQIPSYLTPMLLSKTDADLVLYGRDVSSRLSNSNNNRVKIIDGDFEDKAKLEIAMQGVDVVYMNAATGDVTVLNSIVELMKKVGAKKFIPVSILDIYGEVAGAFGEWNRRMVGDDRIEERRRAADFIEASGIDYSILRLTWLYNQDGNYNYEVTQKGEPFKGAQVTRQAVAKLVVDIIKDTNGKFAHTSLGVGEPNTDYEKPSFY